MARMRLDKLLGTAGLTRKQAREAVSSGRVTLAGAPITDPGHLVDAGAQQVALDGQPVSPPGELTLMIHKPQGLLTATEDARAPTVMDLLPEPLRRRGLGPVGRLDKDTTGLVLMTTDGQLAHRLISPRWKLEKVYLARVEGALTPEDVAAFARGMALTGFTAQPARLLVLESGAQSLAQVTLTEGKYHQVKRMFGALGHPVLQLHRQQLAGLTLDPALPPGGWRMLEEAECALLYEKTQLSR